MKLIFGDFLPDLPDYGSEGVSDAVNVFPAANGFRPVGQFEPHVEALPGPCLGASNFIAPSGRNVLIAGTANALYRQDGNVWAMLSDGYTVPDGNRWRFVQYGDIAIITNAVDPPIKVNLETDATALLGGTPPKMQALAVVGNFVVGTQIDGQVNQVAWSGENDSEWWTYAQRKSDYQEFVDGGEITGIVGGDIGLVLQRNAVRRMAYIGGNILFRFDKISSNVGCASVHSVVQNGELAFWYSDTGFKMWDGAQIRSIGHEQVDASFAGGYEVADMDKLSAAIDGRKHTVIWSTGLRMWIYNWLLTKWTIIDFPAEIVTQRQENAPGLEEEDTLVGEPDEELENSGLDSFDAARFRSGDPLFFIFADGVMGSFSGLNQAARVTGRTLEMVEGRDARVRRIRPLTDATDGLTVRLSASQRLGDDKIVRDFSTLQASGEMPVRSRGRYIRARLSIAEGTDWTYLHGLDATLEVGGRR